VFSALGLLGFALVTTALDRSFSADHAVLMAAGLFAGALLGGIIGAALSRDDHRRQDPNDQGPA
jgi:hypothetical protein